MKTPRLGPGRMQWNAGGWFGAAFGGTLWMLISAALLFAHDARVGAIVLGCYVISVVIAAALWWRRDRLAPYAAIQVLFVTIGVFGVLALAVVHGAGLLTRLDPRMNPTVAFLMFLVIPVVMVIAHFVEHGGTRR